MQSKSLNRMTHTINKILFVFSLVSISNLTYKFIDFHEKHHNADRFIKYKVTAMHILYTGCIALSSWAF